MRWFKEHKAISTIVSVLIILVLVFSVSVLKEGKGNTVTETIHSGFNEVTTVLFNAEKKVTNTARGIFKYRELVKQLDELQAENEELKKELAENSITDEELAELRKLSEVLNYSYTDTKFDIISCDITSFDGASTRNTFTINKGKDDGIEVGNCVVNGMGLVGRITETGDKWSKVHTILDDGTGISLKLAIDASQLGVVKGDGEGGVAGYMMNDESTVSEGDVIITSGLGIYPKGIEIGCVKSVEYNSNTLLKEIEIEPGVDFNALEKVAVIR